MKILKIVVDTNVLVSALRSSRGASFRLMMLLDSGKFELFISVPLILEYEYATKRLLGEINLTESDIDDVLDYICTVAVHQKIFFLWRPYLRDPEDDMILELALNSGCETIITFNKRDFEQVEKFGISIMTPKEFLKSIGEI